MAALDIPPFQVQKLIDSVSEPHRAVEVRCAQASGSEIYVGCSNGELLRFALQADDPNKLQSYSLLSRQTVPGDKPVEEIVLIPNLSRALVLSDHQVHFYTTPSLDPFPIKPIRHVVALAVDDNHLKRPQVSSSSAGIFLPVDTVDFCIVKRNGIALYTVRDRLSYLKEIPLPSGQQVTLAKRIGSSLCFADNVHYNMLDLEKATLFPILPIDQAESASNYKPSITVISPNEFLVLSWTGASTLGLFITDDGDPVRGTLEWPSYPLSISLDYPYITSLLPNNTIEIHNVETQGIVQVISAPHPSLPSSRVASPTKPSHQRQSSVSSSHHRGSSGGSTHVRGGSSASASSTDPSKRVALVSSIGGYLVPSTQRMDKMRKIPIKLIR